MSRSFSTSSAACFGMSQSNMYRKALLPAEKVLMFLLSLRHRQVARHDQVASLRALRHKRVSVTSLSRSSTS
eukprot:5777821-Pleurochrysis_carterae.AAC.2